MEETQIIKQEYMKLANAYSKQVSIESTKENIRKDIELLLDVLGHHTITKGYSETSDVKYVIDDEIDRARISKKLLTKINKL